VSRKWLPDAWPTQTQQNDWMTFLDRLFDRLLGGPTLERLLREVQELLEADGYTDIEVVAKRQEVLAVQRGDRQTIYVGNVLGEYQKLPRSQRPALLRKFLGGLAATEPIANSYATSKHQLMPVVRSRAAMGVARQSSSGPGAPAGSQAAFQPLVADLVIGLVLDSPNSMSYVQERTLTDWGVTWEEALQDATENLRGLPEHGGWQVLAPGVWSGAWGDSYESSRILIPDLIYRLGVADPVVMVPFRHALLVASASDPQAIDTMIRETSRAMADQGRWLSFEILRLEGTSWSPFLVSGDAASTLSAMRIRNQAEAYEGQRQVLEGQFEEQNNDIFVASCTLIEVEGHPLSSYSVWSEGVDTLLPESQSVVLRYEDGEASWHTRLPWHTVVEQFGQLLEATDYMPARFRVRQFPDRSALQVLAEASGI
jgi:hypothetical protein